MYEQIYLDIKCQKAVFNRKTINDFLDVDEKVRMYV